MAKNNGEDSKPARTKADIEADLAAARTRLSANVASLIDEIHPNRIAERQVEGVKQMASAEFDNAKSQFIDADGNARVGRIVAIGGAVAGAVAFLVLLKVLGGRHDK